MLDVGTLYESLASVAEDDHPNTAPLVTKVAQLVRMQEHVTPDTTNEEVREKFLQLESVASLAVVEHGVPVGLINRNQFMEQYAKPFARDLYGRKSCIAFMDKSPLVIDAETPIETLVKAAVESGGKVLNDGYIATSDGTYSGVGTGFGLMKAMSDIEAEKTKQLLSSISYASLIQKSHLVESNRVLKERIRNFGLIWEPRDVVGGDAYYFREVADGIFGCVFDCTGHGVPGAFMTLIVMSFFEQAVPSDASNIDPSEVLTKLNHYIKRVLRQEDKPASQTGGVDASNDGLDAAVFVIRDDWQEMLFASAKLDLVIKPASGEGVVIIDGESTPLGYSDTPSNMHWPLHRITLEPNSMMVIPTDGVIDQVGGPKSIAHGRRRLIKFVEERSGMDAGELSLDFLSSFKEWQGTQRRRDDVSLLAFKVPGN